MIRRTALSVNISGSTVVTHFGAKMPRAARFKDFSGHPAGEAQRPQRQLSERRQAQVLPLQRNEPLQGRKMFLSASRG